MMNARPHRRLLASLLALAVLSCGEPAEAPPREEPAPGAPSRGDTAAPAADTPSANAATPATRMAFPGLFSIMAGLEADMARVDRGLWEGSFDTIAAGARRVADHPPIPPAEAERIASVLGADMARFQELDRTVHDLAVRTEEAAARGELDAVLDALTGLRAGCTTCHAEFRTRLRDAVR